MNIFEVSALVLAGIVSNEILSLCVLLYFAGKVGLKVLEWSSMAG